MFDSDAVHEVAVVDRSAMFVGFSALRSTVVHRSLRPYYLLIDINANTPQFTDTISFVDI